MTRAVVAISVNDVPGTRPRSDDVSLRSDPVVNPFLEGISALEAREREFDVDGRGELRTNTARRPAGAPAAERSLLADGNADVPISERVSGGHPDDDDGVHIDHNTRVMSG